ncbi:prefoldin subunit beta [Candidatus Pacearchaeota archaeon]|nr:prefoldin subunit beta [Candidatus Pacearchaeota archaeon]
MSADLQTGKKIQELQSMEQNLQNFAMQKQVLQAELNEIDNALAEISTADDDIYKMTAGIMIKTEKKNITKDLNEKKRVIELRAQSFEKQEKIIEDKASKLRAEVTESVKKSPQK